MLATRRKFLTTGAQSVAGVSLLPLLGCSPNNHASTPKNEGSDSSKKLADPEMRIAELMAELHVPGASIAIIKDAKIAWCKGFGVKNQLTGDAVDNDTLFEAQSMSKPVFAYRVMKLCEQGILNLDTPLTKYTPDVFLKGDPRLELITPRRVLSHTTGFPNWRSKEEPMRINFTPGTKWSYSGEGYHYLQSVVTRLTGHTDPAKCKSFELGYRVCATDFGDYMAANVLRPFGMTSSGYVWNETIGHRLVARHDKNGQPIQRAEATAMDVARYGSAGSLLTTATDYAKFLIEVMNPKPADTYRLNQASREEMLRPQVDIPDAPVPMSWALGWQIWHLDKGDFIAHGGDDTGAHSEAMFSIPRKSGFVILTNGDNGYELITNRLLKDLIDIIV